MKSCHAAIAFTGWLLVLLVGYWFVTEQLLVLLIGYWCCCKMPGVTGSFPAATGVNENLARRYCSGLLVTGQLLVLLVSYWCYWGITAFIKVILVLLGNSRNYWRYRKVATCYG